MVSSILPPASQKENIERKETQGSILQIAKYIRKKLRWKEKKYEEPSCRCWDTTLKEKMVRKEIYRTILQKGDGVKFKMQFLAD